MKTKISIHCSLTNRPNHDNVETLYQWHVIENEWSAVGYHFYINRFGDIFDATNHELMRPISRNPAAVLNHNSNMIAICMWGIDENDFTEAQFRSLRALVRRLQFEYNIPREEVKGHNEYSGHETRDCPNFNVQEKLFGWIDKLSKTFLNK